MKTAAVLEQEEIVAMAESAMCSGRWTDASNLVEQLLQGFVDEAREGVIMPERRVGGLNDRIAQWNEAVADRVEERS